MNFIPTENYYGLDFSIEENIVKWHFWEFLKILVTLSKTAEVQKDYIGYGFVTGELTDEFDTYYKSQRSKYIKYKLLDSIIIKDLDNLNNFFEERYGQQENEFWNDDLLDIHPYGEEVRKIAFNILKKCGYDDLEVVIERNIRETFADDGTPLTLESTSTLLKRIST